MIAIVKAFALAALAAAWAFARAHWPEALAGVLAAAAIGAAPGAARYLDAAAVVAVGLLGYHLGRGSR